VELSERAFLFAGLSSLVHSGPSDAGFVSRRRRSSTAASSSAAPAALRSSRGDAEQPALSGGLLDKVVRLLRLGVVLPASTAPGSLPALLLVSASALPSDVQH
jgi:hypothetical protein